MSLLKLYSEYCQVVKGVNKREVGGRGIGKKLIRDSAIHGGVKC